MYFFTCCDVNELIKLIHTLTKLVAGSTSEWEVGAMVAHIMNKFYNIVAGEVTLLSSRAKQTYNVTPGFYRTPDSLLAEIRKATQQWRFDLRSASSLISMRYNKTTNKVEMTIVGDVEVTFGDDLCRALGLAQGTHVSETQRVPRLCNMFFGLSYLFVEQTWSEEGWLGTVKALC